MRTSMDKAGRLVLPKALREQAGLVPGEVEVTLDGTALRVEPADTATLVDREGHLFLADAGGAPVTPESIRDLRLADQR